MSQISPYSIPDLKSTTDDTLPNYLSSLKFVPSHTLTDVRLALGYAAVSIAASLFYFDFKYGWSASRVYTLPAVLLYFLLNGAFTYWIWFVERGCVFDGVRDGTRLRLYSQTRGKFDPVYVLTVRVEKRGEKSREEKIEGRFGDWFTSDGFLVVKPLQRWLAGKVKEIGEADPGNAGAEGDKAVDAEKKSEVGEKKVGADLSELVGLAQQTTGAQATPVGGKGRKRG